MTPPTDPESIARNAAILLARMFPHPAIIIRAWENKMTVEEFALRTHQRRENRPQPRRTVTAAAVATWIFTILLVAFVIGEIVWGVIATNG